MEIKSFLNDISTRIEAAQHGDRVRGDGADLLHQRLDAIRDRIHDGLATIESEEAAALAEQAKA